MTQLPNRSDPDDASRLRELFAAISDGTATKGQLQAFETRLREDAQASEYFARFMQLHVLLEEKFAVPHRFADDEGFCPVGGPKDASVAGPPITSIVLDVSPPLESSPGLFAPGSVLFSYGMSALMVAVGLLVAWSSNISRNQEFAQRQNRAPVTVAPEPELQFVARITGMIDCRWAKGATETSEGAFVALGKRFELAQGLLEITYNGGAKVLLEGPCTYEVDTQESGYLALGKLTARIERPSEVAGGKSDGSVERRPQKNAAAETSSSAARLFAVRTPTAIVTDLGTEFGVEVDRSGVSQAHVFQGRIELRATRGAGEAARAIPLTANESARVEIAEGRVPRIVRQPSTPAVKFLRQLPQRERIKVSNTGLGVKEGEPDPHWQIVARSDDPNFQPRPAVVTPIFVVRVPNSNQIQTFHMPNEPDHSCWISAVSDQTFLPNDVTYTFRTTFDLTGTLPHTAVLRGRLIADDAVTAIRLNGRKLDMPPYRHGGPMPFYEWHPFKATDGFVAGENVLEIDVFNAPASPDKQHRTSLMSCRVELEGSAVRNWKVTDERTNNPPEDKQ